MRISIPWLAGVACSTFLLIACGTEPAAPGAAAPSLFQVDPDKAGSIRGRVLFEGEAPQPARIDMRREPVCEEAHEGPILSQQVVVNPDRTLRNVFVWIREGLEQYRFEVPAEPVRIDQKGCRYTPHVIGVQVGQKLEWSNSDPVDHNVHPIPRENYEWNRTQRAGSAPVTLQYDKPELMIPVKCNLHPWMSSFVNVVPHPFFDISNDLGEFELKGLPPGDYLLEAVHEELGKARLRITVEAGASREAHFSFPPAQ